MKEIKTVYGPYNCKQDDRKRVVIIFMDGTRTTKSYSRFQYESIYGEIPDWLDVDHIDEDATNDSLTNYQLLTKEENKKKHLDAHPEKQKKMLDLICALCDVSFQREERRIKQNQRSQGKAGPFCSKSCAGRYGTMVQNNRLH